MYLIPGMQGCFNINKLTSMTHHSNKMKVANLRIVSIDDVKALDKILETKVLLLAHSICLKTSQNTARKKQKNPINVRCDL